MLWELIVRCNLWFWEKNRR